MTDARTDSELARLESCDIDRGDREEMGSVSSGFCPDHNPLLFPFFCLACTDGLGHVEEVSEFFAGDEDSAGTGAPCSPADEGIVVVEDRYPSETIHVDQMVSIEDTLLGVSVNPSECVVG